MKHRVDSPYTRLRNARRWVAAFMLLLITVLLMDFTGTVGIWAGWAAKIQFLPALLAMNVAVVAVLIVATILFGRVYCSVVCPLGIMQDVVSRLHSKMKPNRFAYRKGAPWLRLVFIVAFVVLMLLGLVSIATLIAPYSAFGRMVTSFLQPIWMFLNNGWADLAAQNGSYATYPVEVKITSAAILAVATVTLVVVVALAWIGGRRYCNSVCPVGTFLGWISQWSMMRIAIDKDKCVGCSLCAKNCKSECIDYKNHSVDGSRCVDCYNCLTVCSKDAIHYKNMWLRPQRAEKAQDAAEGVSRRSFMSIVGLAAAGAAVEAASVKVDGGLAVIEEKRRPRRATKIVPPGAKSIANLTQRCVGCQLCVSKCPNHVLRPQTSVETFMQPESSYDQGYCRPECTACSDVCPTGAIQPITKADKTDIHVGHAVWIPKNCIVTTDGVECGNCARHCPVGAIEMVESQKHDGRKVPAVNEAKCIGCGACEFLCPSRPYSAIYVEGHEVHHA